MKVAKNRFLSPTKDNKLEEIQEQLTRIRSRVSSNHMESVLNSRNTSSNDEDSGKFLLDPKSPNLVKLTTYTSNLSPKFNLFNSFTSSNEIRFKSSPKPRNKYLQ